jgi:hypothetical protein
MTTPESPITDPSEIIYKVWGYFGGTVETVKEVIARYPEDCIEMLRKERKTDWNYELRNIQNEPQWARHYPPLYMHLQHGRPDLFAKLNTMLDSIDGPYSNFRRAWEIKNALEQERNAIAQKLHLEEMRKQTEQYRKYKAELISRRKEQMGSRYYELDACNTYIILTQSKMKILIDEIDLLQSRVFSKINQLEKINFDLSKYPKNEANLKKQSVASQYIETHKNELVILKNNLTQMKQEYDAKLERFNVLKTEHDLIK